MKELVKYMMRLIFWLGLLGVITIIYDAGFEKTHTVERIIYWIYLLAVIGGVIFILTSHEYHNVRSEKKVLTTDFLLIFLCLIIIVQLIINFNEKLPPQHPLLSLVIILLFIRELATYHFQIEKRYINPAQLFIISFISIIIIGTALLMLPRSTNNGIDLIDALFTSTSAVCVTGLSVVDIGQCYTRTGQTIIIILMQAGGLGIMTFTSYFGYFFKGGASYQNRLMIQDMTNSERIADVFSMLKNILMITFIIEFVGSVIIFSSLDQSLIGSFRDRAFFSIFHSVSAFCNAGFSTLTNSLYEIGFRFNYVLQLTVAILIIIGGIGFPIVFDTIRYVKKSLMDRLKNQPSHTPWIIGINTRIVLITTLCLLIGGTLIIYFLEYNNTLSEHTGLGKLVTAFFCATVPRTAGFNSVDMTAINLSTIMLIFILMWIGASPGSTGGGIKTSTFAIAILNFLSLARGKDRIEIFRREISSISARRASAAISLSLIVIGISVFLLSIFDSDKNLTQLAFESVSAFGTVGLSLGITGALSDPGKMIIILTMFIGRVSMLTILVAFLRRIINLKYKYPIEDVLIN